MPRSPLSVLGVLALAAAVSAAPASATLAQPTQLPSSSDRDSAPASAPSVERLAGEHRYATAAEVAAQWPTGVDRAYVVSGQNFPDAMVAAARAGVFDAPVLLTRTDTIPSDTAAALQHLQPNQLVVIGAPGAVSNAVLADLDEFAGDGGVERVSGADRYATAAQLASQYPAGRDRVFLVNGEDYPDALAAAAIAGTQQEPLLLTQPGSLPDVTAQQLARLSPGEVVVVGGTSAVSEAVASEAASHADSDVRRVAGANRYQTAAAVAEEFSANSTPGYVASGQDYADALVASASAGRHGVPVVLTPADRVAAGTTRALEHLAPDNILVVGGPAAVSDTVIDELQGVNPPDPCTGSPTRDTEFGASIYPVGMTAAESLEEIDESFGTVGIVRDFFPGLPPSWDSPRAQLLSERAIVISFRAHPNEINSGSLDSFFRDWFATAPDDQKIYWSYFHEPEPRIRDGIYTFAEYKQAWTRLNSLADESCKPNMFSTLILTAWTTDPLSGRDYKDYDAGKDVIDVIAFDPYNGLFEPDRDFYEDINEFLDPMADIMEEDGRPWGLAELGSRIVVGDDGTGRAQWLTELGEYMIENDASFVTYFQTTRDGNWRLDDEPSRNAWKELVQG